jgi:hypothetical protein
MSNKAPFFKGFHKLFHGPRRQSVKEKMIAEARALQQASLCQLAQLFSPWIDLQLLSPTAAGASSRQRDYSIAVTFWAFLVQVITPNCGCREIVRKIQGWYAIKKCRIPSEKTGAFCQARKRLPLDTLRAVHEYTARAVNREVITDEQWHNRAVKLIDGSCLSMPDTPENQREFPQPPGQKQGCGFPVVKIVGCFSLATGALIDWAEGTLKQHESRLAKSLWHLFHEGDILLTDRGFCSYVNIADMWRKGVDSVIRLKTMGKLDWRKGKKLSQDDRLVVWQKPKYTSVLYTKREWKALPDSLTLRLVRCHVNVPGYRTETIFLVTTLTDIAEFTTEDLAQLYLKRWGVELFYRDIKTTLCMDVLRCKTPDMVRKEIAMHAIAYNLIRAVMQRAAKNYRVRLNRISFKGTVDIIRQWHEVFMAVKNQAIQQARIISVMLEIIAQDAVPYRPGRSEPRAVKRRPKNYQRLTNPRHEMVVTPHRNRPVYSTT